MKTSKRLASCAVLATCTVFAALQDSANGATFTTELTLSPAPNQWGEHLTASYDFGVAFREVHSVWLELDIPEGYEGTMMSTGNSMLHRRLAIEIYDPTDPPPVESLLEFVGNSTILIPPGSSVKFSFARLQPSIDCVVQNADWPSFVLSGGGNVSIVDASTTYYLPDGEGSTATTTWNLPSGIRRRSLGH